MKHDEARDILEDYLATLIPDRGEYYTDLRCRALETAIEALKKDEIQVAYICDRTACTPCNNPDCGHTCDIGYAKNFIAVDRHKYMERDYPR